MKITKKKLRQLIQEELQQETTFGSEEFKEGDRVIFNGIPEEDLDRHDREYKYIRNLNTKYEGEECTIDDVDGDLCSVKFDDGFESSTMSTTFFEKV